jgi:RND family efflux transporter MFP subunit
LFQSILNFCHRFYYRTIIFLVVVFSVTNTQAAPGGRAAPVMVEFARLVFMAPQTWVAGTVISRYEARLAAEVDGKITFVAEVGTQVAEDDVLAKIDSTFVKLKIEEFKAAVERDRANLEFLKGDLKRLKSLALQSNASQTRLDRTRADREVARNELRISRSRLKQAREEKRRHFIRAPFAGVVVERHMRRGERASVGDDVLSLVDSRELEVQARVPLDTLDYVREGDVLTLKVNAEEKQAKVRALVAAGDLRSRLLDLRLALTENGLTIGRPVRIALPTAIAKEVLAVPRDALVLRRDGAAVFRVANDNKAERISVQLGVASGSLVAIVGDIKVGDRVVTRGGERLRPGQTVKILNVDVIDKRDSVARKDDEKNEKTSNETSNKKSPGQ